MAFTAKNKKPDFSGVMPLWVEELAAKYPKLRTVYLQNAEKIEDYPRVILTFPGQHSADMAIENCGKTIQAFWHGQQIIYRFKHFNAPDCKRSQHLILKAYDPTHREEVCDVCKAGYGCRRSEPMKTAR